MTDENEYDDPQTVSPLELQRRMYHLRMGGMSYPQISERMGVELRRVRLMISSYTELLEQAAGDDEKRQALYLENSRLDALQNAAWDAAMLGDMKAIDAILKISARRSKIMGMDLVPTQEIQVTQNTLVMGSKEEFIAALEEGRGRQEPENVIEGRIVREEVQ